MGFVADKIAQHIWFIAAGWLVLSYAILRSPLRSVITRRRTNQAFIVASSLLAIAGALVAFVYGLLPVYFDHVEPGVVVDALNAHAGLPLHPDWRAGEGAWGWPYGPLLFHLVGWPLLFSKTVVASKLATTAAFLLGLAAIAAAPFLCGQRARAPESLYYLLTVLCFGFEAFLVRPEPLLLALAALAIFAGRLRNVHASLFALGLLAGLAAAIKADAPLYFVPFAAEALLRPASLRRIATALVFGALGLAAGLGLGFGIHAKSIVSYAAYLALAAHHPLLGRLLFLNLLASTVLLAPVAVDFFWAGNARPHPRQLLVGLATALSMLLVTVIASKAGAGPHHLIPFAPGLLFLLLNRSPTAISPYRAGAALLPIIATAALAVVSSAVVLGRLAASLSAALVGYDEAALLAGRHPGAQFGPTDQAHYEVLYDRVGAALRGARLTTDIGVWFDFVEAGLTTAVDPEDFAFDRPRVWILPKEGEPFSLTRNYTKAPLFTVAYRREFLKHCRPAEAGRVFRVWTCV